MLFPKDIPYRIEVLRAMETMARCINDEEVLEVWLINGVPDGEIGFATTDEELVYLVEDDDDFADLMHTFLNVMKRASWSGGLHCNMVTSKERSVE